MSRSVFRFHCPCCDKLIEVDTRSGAARAVRAAEAKGGTDLDRLLSAHQQDQKRLDDLFDSAREREAQQQDLLEQQLRKAKEDAKQRPDERPRTPFDLD